MTDANSERVAPAGSEGFSASTKDKLSDAELAEGVATPRDAGGSSKGGGGGAPMMMPPMAMGRAGAGGAGAGAGGAGAAGAGAMGAGTQAAGGPGLIGGLGAPGAAGTSGLGMAGSRLGGAAAGAGIGAAAGMGIGGAMAGGRSSAASGLSSSFGGSSGYTMTASGSRAAGIGSNGGIDTDGDGIPDYFPHRSDWKTGGTGYDPTRYQKELEARQLAVRTQQVKDTAKQWAELAAEMKALHTIAAGTGVDFAYFTPPKAEYDATSSLAATLADNGAKAFDEMASKLSETAESYDANESDAANQSNVAASTIELR